MKNKDDVQYVVPPLRTIRVTLTGGATEDRQAHAYFEGDRGGLTLQILDIVVPGNPQTARTIASKIYAAGSWLYAEDITTVASTQQDLSKSMKGVH